MVAGAGAVTGIADRGAKAMVGLSYLLLTRIVLFIYTSCSKLDVFICVPKRKSLTSSGQLESFRTCCMVCIILLCLRTRENWMNVHPKFRSA